MEVYIRAHQHSAGAQAKGDQTIGLSRGGKTTKIRLVVDSFRFPIHFEITCSPINWSRSKNSYLLIKLRSREFFTS